MSAEDISPWREHWNPGEEAFFEYHCWESHESADAELWYRSHQKVTVLGPAEDWEGWDDSGMTFNERCEAGHARGYQVRFEDGFEYEVFEDELMEDRSGFHRPDPPEPKERKP